MKDMVTLGTTGITVNKNGFGALPIQRISQEDAVHLAARPTRPASASSTPPAPTPTAK